MQKNKSSIERVSTLRQNAEDILKEQSIEALDNIKSLSYEEIKRTIHELRVHQIELEMQNEELSRVNEEKDAIAARYFDLYDLAPVGYCTLSDKGIIIEANLTAANLLGIPRRELIKKPFSRFILPEDQTLYYHQYHKPLLNSCQLDDNTLELGLDDNILELRMVKQDGTTFWAHLKATVGQNMFCPDATKQERGVICRVIINDISELKRIQNELNQAQKMESIGRLAGGVAHYFNNLLMAIIGYTELSIYMVDDDLIRENLMEILKAAKRSADITQQLLAFARKQTAFPKILNINDSVGVLLEILRRLIGENIYLKWKPCLDLWQVKIDSSQMDQILINLCINAKDAINGVGNITIATDNVTRDKIYCSNNEYSQFTGDYVILIVSDDGCGMEKEVLDNIFEPFFTTKEVGKGTGLGLSTVYGIVKQNNGFVNVLSKPKKGTTCHIYLPRCMESVSQI
ncbi:MAG: PAS domain-containing protein [Desulfamplus sp.]|nr:PAS domain-containing protein [Desulfamplus sp.]